MTDLPRFQPPGPEAPPDEDLFGWALLVHYLGFAVRAPLRHRALAIVSFVVVFGVGIAGAAVFPPRYRINASVLAGSPLTGALGDPHQDQRDNPARAAREIMLRHDNLVDIVNRTNFVERYMAARPWAVRAKDWVFENVLGRQRDPEDLRDGLVDTLAAKLSVWTTPENAVEISFEWWDPEIAKTIVEGAMQSFLDMRRASEVKTFEEAITILDDQRKRLESDIAASTTALDQKVTQLRIPAPRRTVAPRPVSEDRALAGMQSELSDARKTIASIESARESRLRDLRAQLLQQESTYAADHPALIATRRELDSLAEPSDRVVELRSRVKELEAEVAKRGGRSAVVDPGPGPDPFADARLRLDTDDPRLEFESQQLENQLKQYADLRARIDAARVQMATADAAFKHRYSVISPPQLPRGPVKPFGLMFVLAGIVGGVALALFTSTAADFRSGRIIERWQVEESLDLPVLADIGK